MLIFISAIKRPRSSIVVKDYTKSFQTLSNHGQWTLLVQWSKENQASFVICALGIGRKAGEQHQSSMPPCHDGHAHGHGLGHSHGHGDACGNCLDDIYQHWPKGKSGFFCDLCIGQSSSSELLATNITLHYLPRPLHCLLLPPAMLQPIMKKYIKQFGQIHFLILTNPYRKKKESITP